MNCLGVCVQGSVAPDSSTKACREMSRDTISLNMPSSHSALRIPPQALKEIPSHVRSKDLRNWIFVKSLISQRRYIPKHVEIGVIHTLSLVKEVLTFSYD